MLRPSARSTAWPSSPCASWHPHPICAVCLVPYARSFGFCFLPEVPGGIPKVLKGGVPLGTKDTKGLRCLWCTPGALGQSPSTFVLPCLSCSGSSTLCSPAAPSGQSSHALWSRECLRSVAISPLSPPTASPFCSMPVWQETMCNRCP